jgi:hypothetical protein
VAKLGRKRVAGTIAAGAPLLLCNREKRWRIRPSNTPDRQTIVQLLRSGWLVSGTSTFGAGASTIPKRASPVFVRLYANSNFAHAAFSTGSEKTS